MPVPIRLALIGAGTFASSAHRSALTPLLSSHEVEIILVWSRSATSAIALSTTYTPPPAPHHQLPTHSSSLISIRDALKIHSNLDAAILALPPGIQEEVAAECLQLGLHVMIEKPLAVDVQAARRLMTVAEGSDRMLAVAENFRFEPALHAAKDMVGGIGDVIAARLSAHVPMKEGSKYGRGWRLKLGGPGMLMDGGVHYMAALRLMFGEVESVYAKCGRKTSWFEGCDSVSANLVVGEVDVAVFISYACDIFAWEIRVVGTMGEVVVERLKGGPGYGVSIVKKIGSKEVVEGKDYMFEGIDAEFRAFVESMRSGKLHPGLSAKQAFADLATVWAMYESSESKKVVRVATCGAIS